MAQIPHNPLHFVKGFGPELQTGIKRVRNLFQLLFIVWGAFDWTESLMRK